ncbi:fructosamine-3-kinase [Evansella vedderi]|uniref:Fructosamine-3-kinase n=1 Tax=Evansella vedderi TaxID=38282 RepID=A0ABT9ZVD0_9BACI|nr:fructosamine kinase family protein [Evansella vedderi]MDQ0255194.1 fructosamine-3-kinase [Evansella vedderi]
MAFTELFGGLPCAFYEEYKSTNDIDPEYENRRPIYQLFYLLVHLNIFGEIYGKQVDGIINRYTPLL